MIYYSDIFYTDFLVIFIYATVFWKKVNHFILGNSCFILFHEIRKKALQLVTFLWCYHFILSFCNFLSFHLNMMVIWYLYLWWRIFFFFFFEVKKFKIKLCLKFQFLFNEKLWISFIFQQILPISGINNYNGLYPYNTNQISLNNL